MATVLFIFVVLKHFLKISKFWGPVPLMRWNTLGATPTAQNIVIEKFSKLCTASSCGLSPKSFNQVEVQLCNHWQTQIGKCIGQSHTPWGTFLTKSVRNCLEPFLLQCLIICNQNPQAVGNCLRKSPQGVFLMCLGSGVRIGYTSDVLHFVACFGRRTKQKCVDVPFMWQVP